MPTPPSITTPPHGTIDPRQLSAAELLNRATVAIESMRTQWRADLDLGTHERMTISQLRMHGSMPMSELASRIALSRAAVTSLIDRLEAERWVRRTPDPHDRRRTVLALEPAALTRFEEQEAAWWSYVTERTDQLDATTTHRLAALLADFVTRAEATADELRRESAASQR